MSAKPKFVLIRVNCAGYAGEPISLLCSFDPATDMLLVMKSTKYNPADAPGFLRITTQERDAAHDAVFTEDETHDAITAFFSLDSMSLINLADPAKRFDPRNAIERAGMDASGMKYNINPAITNGQMGVMIAAYFSKKQRDVASIETFMNDVIFTV